MKKFRYLFTVLSLIITVPTFAQVNVKGQIVDGADKAIEYVTVVAMDDSTGVVADGNGVFEIKVRNANVQLSFSHVSYENFTVKASELFYFPQGASLFYKCFSC